MQRIKTCLISEIQTAHNIKQLLSEYAIESSIHEIGSFKADWDKYQLLEDAGVLHFLGAFVDDDLVGFCSIILTDLPHYSTRIATTESFFIASAYRSGGIGIKILKAIEKLAANLGAKALLISAPHQGRLEKMLAHKDYRITNTIFTKGLNA